MEIICEAFTIEPGKLGLPPLFVKEPPSNPLIPYIMQQVYEASSVKPKIMAVPCKGDRPPIGEVSCLFWIEAAVVILLIYCRCPLSLSSLEAFASTSSSLLWAGQALFGTPIGCLTFILSYHWPLGLIHIPVRARFTSWKLSCKQNRPIHWNKDLY